MPDCMAKYTKIKLKLHWEVDKRGEWIGREEMGE